MSRLFLSCFLASVGTCFLASDLAAQVTYNAYASQQASPPQGAANSSSAYARQGAKAPANYTGANRASSGSPAGYNTATSSGAYAGQGANAPANYAGANRASSGPPPGYNTASKWGGSQPSAGPPPRTTAATQWGNQQRTAYSQATGAGRYAGSTSPGGFPQATGFPQGAGQPGRFLPPTQPRPLRQNAFVTGGATCSCGAQHASRTPQVFPTGPQAAAFAGQASTQQWASEQTGRWEAARATWRPPGMLPQQGATAVASDKVGEIPRYSVARRAPKLPMAKFISTGQTIPGNSIEPYRPQPGDSVSRQPKWSQRIKEFLWPF